MRRRLEPIPIDLEIDKTFHRKLREKKSNTVEPTTMANNDGNGDVNADDIKPLRDFGKPLRSDIQAGMNLPRITVANFEMKPGTIQFVQNSGTFGGAMNEDPKCTSQEIPPNMPQFPFKRSYGRHGEAHFVPVFSTGRCFGLVQCAPGILDHHS